jgi:hypothetical protein
MERSASAIHHDDYAGVNGHADDHDHEKNANGPSDECEDASHGRPRLTNFHARGNARLQLLEAAIGQLQTIRSSHA